MGQEKVAFPGVVRQKERLLFFFCLYHPPFLRQVLESAVQRAGEPRDTAGAALVFLQEPPQQRLACTYPPAEERQPIFACAGGNSSGQDREPGPFVPTSRLVPTGSLLLQFFHVACCLACFPGKKSERSPGR